MSFELLADTEEYVSPQVQLARMIVSGWLAALVLVTAPLQVLSAKNHDFKLCQQQSFCRRLRGLGERSKNEGFQSPYSLESPVLRNKGQAGASWTFPLRTGLYADIEFELQLDILKAGDGIARIRVDEVNSKLPWKRYNEASKWALLESEPARADVKSVTQSSSNGVTTFTYGDANYLSLEIQHEPLLITFKQGGEVVMVINDQKLFHMEHFRLKDEETSQTIEGSGEGEGQVVMQTTTKPDTKWFEGEPDGEAFQEKWKQWTDSKPKGRHPL